MVAHMKVASIRNNQVAMAAKEQICEQKSTGVALAFSILFLLGLSSTLKSVSVQGKATRTTTTGNSKRMRSRQVTPNKQSTIE